ncbi:MAG: helix-turn-helix domain-containing protein [Candidatus Taylorbacteria bacterium]|nr:helix-turn-helix domain-containing protein [Candidatus Taylorbacteria bacterium]
MSHLETLLNDIGLTPKESSVYIALLKLGSASAYAISEMAGIKPPTTYLTLQNLIRKNIVITLPRAKKQLFAVKPPEELIKMYEDKVSRIKKSLPQFEALVPDVKPQIKVSYYQGYKGVEEALHYSDKRHPTSKEMIAFYASGEKIDEKYIELSKRYMTTRHKLGTIIRGITPKDPTYDRELQKFNESLGYNILSVPHNEYSAQASIEADDYIVRIIMLKEEKALIIENAELAKMVRQIFEMVWKVKKP